MSVLYYNNCWFTNVGEAFIDIGAMEMIKKIFPNVLFERVDRRGQAIDAVKN